MSGFTLGFQSIGSSVLDGEEVKLLYTARATHGHRFGGVSTTPRSRDLFLLVLFFG